MFDREQWERWFAELERPFIFLLILLFVVIAVGLLARFSERFRQ